MTTIAQGNGVIEGHRNSKLHLRKDDFQRLRSFRPEVLYLLSWGFKMGDYEVPWPRIQDIPLIAEDVSTLTRSRLLPLILLPSFVCKIANH
jgi:hypothetical protein